MPLEIYLLHVTHVTDVEPEDGNGSLLAMAAGMGRVNWGPECVS